MELGNSRLYMKSLAGAPRPMVGFDLDQAIPPRVFGVGRSMFFRRLSSIYLLDRTSASASINITSIVVSLLTGQSDMYHHNSVDDIYLFRSRRCVSVVRLGTMDLQPSSRDKMARRCSTGRKQEISPSKRNSTCDEGIFMGTKTYEECRLFLETRALQNCQHSQYDWR